MKSQNIYDNETDEERHARIYPVVLSEYNPAWAEWYSEEKANLERLIGIDVIARISHYGSTSVPGLIAKPTVDILLEIKDDTDIDKLKTTMSEYIFLHEFADIVPLHLMFLKGYLSDGFAEKVYHIHVRYSGDWDELYFRDYLIAHPETAKEYAKLKKSLFDKNEHDRDGYTEAQGEFIRTKTALAKCNHKICFCGHDCSRCITYLATVKDDENLRRQSQQFYKNVFERDIPLEDIRCFGGRLGNIFKLCNECPWMKCCKERGLNACNECENYPCQPLADYQAKYVNKCNQIQNRKR